MATPQPQPAPGARQVDPTAVDAALRRLALAPQPPWLHGEVARRMAERLAVIRLRPETIVDWWGWTGASAALLHAAYPAARRLVVEPLAVLRERSRAEARRPWWTTWRGAAPRVEVLAGEPAPASAQLVWSNMTLHAMADPPAVLGAWQRALGEGGFAMYSCLGPDTVRELRSLYRAQGWGPPGVDFVDMHDLGDMMVHAGFADPVMDQERLTLTWDTPQAALAELRGLGANVAPGRLPGLRTPRWRERLLAALRAGTGSGGRLSMSFEIVYGHAFKAPPRPPKGDTRVSLDEMRALARSPRAATR